MHNIIHTLQQDHHQFQSLIKLVHQQMNALKSGETSDCAWLVDGMQLIQRYLDTLHQPVEDVFQEKLLSRSGRAYGLLKPLLNDDRLQFVEHSNRFIETLEGILRGNVIPRNEAVGYGERAIAELYRQIVFEERAVFPYAIDLLDADDWMTLDQDIHDWKEATPIANGLRKDYRQLISRLDVRVH